MAICVPETIKKIATAGERSLFNTLKNYLPDDYLVYYEPAINGKRPDFVIIGPDLGLIVLEVKDYTKNTLYQLNNDKWELHNSLGEINVVKSPLVQAREYTFDIVDKLKKDKNLIHLDGKYKFNLKFPYGYGVVMTRLTQKEYIDLGLYRIINPSFILTKDEMDSNSPYFSVENLIEKIMNMFIVPFRLSEPLSIEEINAIRYHLFPEVRISAKVEDTVPYQDQLLLSLHDIRIMDYHQENLAKQLGDKNRLIRGVAGSGKTLILVSRAKLLVREHPEWKILILCYNISLSQRIRQILYMKDDREQLSIFEDIKPDYKNIKVRNFHEWLKYDLRISENKLPHFLDKIEKGEVILPKYDAIMIDEGQDFEPEWLHLVSKLLNEETQSLLLVEDRAQTIYNRKRSYIQDTGLSFRGRSKILSINYRNTAQIVKFAWDFYQTYSSFKDKVVEGSIEGIEIIPPQATKRKGKEPEIYRAKNFNEEIDYVSDKILELHKEKKVPLSEILIVYRVKRTNKLYIIDIIKNILEKNKIPYFWLSENEETKRKFSSDDNKVKISTIESSKGMDFQAVFVVNVDNMPFPLEENKEREVSLLYIAMTRAIEYLSISYSNQSEFTRYFEKVKQEKLNTGERVIR